MSDPNAGASAESIQNKLDGLENGTPLSYRKVALLQPSKIFGLATNYPYPEGPNTSSSQLDQQTTIAKILSRTYTASDGKTYDAFDALMTILESVVKQ